MLLFRLRDYDSLWQTLLQQDVQDAGAILKWISRQAKFASKNQDLFVEFFLPYIGEFLPLTTIKDPQELPSQEYIEARIRKLTILAKRQSSLAINMREALSLGVLEPRPIRTTPKKRQQPR